MKIQKAKVLSDINVTSLVDVTLVLLIVFMITAPFMRTGVKVELPQAVNKQPHPQKAILVSINAGGIITIDDKEVEMASVAGLISRIRKMSPQKPVLVEGDTKVAYGRIVQVMDEIKSAGVEDVGLVLGALKKRKK